MIMMYSFLHDGLGLHEIPSFFPGYEAYGVFGPLNWLVVYAGIGVMVPGVIIMVISFVINRFRTGKKTAIETVETGTE
jgi:hypothetical protein